MTNPLILNVDDHEPGRYARSRLLSMAGYTVTEAASGPEALNLVKLMHPSLVILDVNLPGLNGLEVCRQVKSNAATANTAVLQISASAVSPFQRVEGLDNGADSYLVEPVDSAVLLATVRALLRMRKAEEELKNSNAALRDANAEMAKMNRSLIRSNEDLHRFAHLASHDLQEPLRTISSFAALLERRYRGRLDEEAGEFFDHIRKGTERMHLLIRDLLLYAEAGHDREPPTAIVNMEEVLRWALNDLETAVSDSGAVITHSPLPIVLGDAIQLTQLLQNLISNALKYRRPDVPLRIEVSAQKLAEGNLLFSVKDNGLGVAREHHERIFAPFTRLHGQEVPGTGIGLASCMKIIERHDGLLWVESEGEDKGSIFNFTLAPAE